MKVPALAARAPPGLTKLAPGMGDASICRTMERMEVSRPPGVSSPKIGRTWGGERGWQYGLRISDWSSDVCSSDLFCRRLRPARPQAQSRLWIPAWRYPDYWPASWPRYDWHTV